jgi:hypothetical protein
MFHVTGKLQDLEKKPWANDPQKFNNNLIIADEYEDRFGNVQNQYTSIEVMPNELGYVEAFVQQNRGKQVCVNVRCEAFSYTNSRGAGAFLKVKMLGGTQIEILDAKKELKAVNG